MIRFAVESDLETIAQLIRALAEYEKLGHEVTFSLDVLRSNLFGASRFAEVLLAEDAVSGEIVGFALFFHNFSTFVGKPGIYLEDLFVQPQHRRNGHGRALLQRLAQLAVERGCGRLEWAVLDWNRAAIDFYRSLGAVPLAEWTVFRVAGDALQRLARTSPINT